MRRDPAYCFKRNEDIFCKEIDGELALVDPYRRVLLQINPAGFQIWQLCDGAHTLKDIASALTGMFEGRASDIQRDVVVFIGDLEKRELVF